MSTAFEAQRMQELREFYIERNNPTAAMLVDKMFSMMPFDDLKEILFKRHGELPRNWQQKDRYAKYKDLLRKGYSRKKVKKIMESDGLDPGELMWDKKYNKKENNVNYDNYIPPIRGRSNSSTSNGSKSSTRSKGRSRGRSLLQKLSGKPSFTAANFSDNYQSPYNNVKKTSSGPHISLQTYQSTETSELSSNTNTSKVKVKQMLDNVKNNVKRWSTSRSKQSKIPDASEEGFPTQKNIKQRKMSQEEVYEQITMDVFAKRKEENHRRTVNEKNRVSNKRTSKNRLKNQDDASFGQRSRSAFSLGSFQDFLSKFNSSGMKSGVMDDSESFEVNEALFGTPNKQVSPVRKESKQGTKTFAELAESNKFDKSAENDDQNLVIDPLRASQFLFTADDLEGSDQSDEDKAKEDDNNSMRNVLYGKDESSDSLNDDFSTCTSHNVNARKKTDDALKNQTSKIGDNANTIGVLHDLQPYFKPRRVTISETSVHKIARRASTKAKMEKEAKFDEEIKKELVSTPEKHVKDRNVEKFVELDLSYNNTTNNFRVKKADTRKNIPKQQGQNQKVILPLNPVVPPRKQRRNRRTVTDDDDISL